MKRSVFMNMNGVKAPCLDPLAPAYDALKTSPYLAIRAHQKDSYLFGRQPRGSSIQEPFATSYVAPCRHHHANGNHRVWTCRDDVRCEPIAVPKWAHAPHL